MDVSTFRMMCLLLIGITSHTTIPGPRPSETTSRPASSEKFGERPAARPRTPPIGLLSCGPTNGTPIRPKEIDVSDKILADTRSRDVRAGQDHPHRLPAGKFRPFPRQQVRERLDTPSPYFVERGYSPEVLDRHDVGHSARLGKSIVPLYDDRGDTCVGYLARSEWPRCRRCGKYHRPGRTCPGWQPI